MKKKIAAKTTCLFLALMMLMQVFSVSASAKSIAEEQTPEMNAITSYAPKKVMPPFAGIIARLAVFTSLFYSGHMSRVNNLELISVHYQEKGNTTAITAQFRDKSIFGYSNITVPILIGNKTYWNEVVKDSNMMLRTLNNTFNAFLAIAAATRPGGAETAGKSLLKSVNRIITDKQLKEKVTQLPNDGHIVYIAGFLYDTKFLGNMSQEWADTNSTLAVGSDGLEVPESLVLPGWVENGPPVTTD